MLEMVETICVAYLLLAGLGLGVLKRAAKAMDAAENKNTQRPERSHWQQTLDRIEKQHHLRPGDHFRIRLDQPPYFPPAPGGSS